MKFQRVAIAFCIFNLLFLVFLAVERSSSAQQAVAPVLRARLIELVDENGKVRAQLKIENDGETVFRIRDQQGVIRTKLSGGDTGSGLSFMDERPKATVQIRANQNGGTVSLFTRAGQENVVK